MLSLNTIRLVRSVWVKGSAGPGTQVMPSVVVHTWPLLVSAMQVAVSSAMVPTATKPLPWATIEFTWDAPSTGKLPISCQPLAPAVPAGVGTDAPLPPGEDDGLTLGEPQ